MLRYRRQAYLVRFCQFAYCGVAGRQLLKDSPPYRVGQCPEDLVQVEDNVAASGIDLDPETLQRIDEALEGSIAYEGAAS